MSPYVGGATTSTLPLSKPELAVDNSPGERLLLIRFRHEHRDFVGPPKNGLTALGSEYQEAWDYTDGESRLKVELRPFARICARSRHPGRRGVEGEGEGWLVRYSTRGARKCATDPRHTYVATL